MLPKTCNPTQMHSSRGRQEPEQFMVPVRHCSCEKKLSLKTGIYYLRQLSTKYFCVIVFHFSSGVNYTLLIYTWSEFCSLCTKTLSGVLQLVCLLHNKHRELTWMQQYPSCVECELHFWKFMKEIKLVTSTGIEVQRVLISLRVSFLRFFSPSGKKFRSKPQLARYLGSSMDLSTFDFRTGKMLMSKMNKNRQRMRYDCSNQAKVRVRCSGSFLPVHMLCWPGCFSEQYVE